MNLKEFSTFYCFFQGYNVPLNKAWFARVKDYYQHMKRGYKFNQKQNESICKVIAEKYIGYENYVESLNQK